jgi:hypothetical protein
MNAVFGLLALSAIAGFALGPFSWLAIGLCGLVLAVLSSAALHVQGFGALPGITILAVCLALNQMGYLVGVYATHRWSKKPTSRSKLKLPELF